MPDSTTLVSFQDLDQFGLNCLTGERCAYCWRLLFDLNEEGATLVRQYLDLPFDSRFCDPWNSRVNGQPSVGSVMLSRAVVRDLMIFSLFHVSNYDCVVVSPTQVTGFNADHPYATGYLELIAQKPAEYTLHRNCRKGSGQPGDGNFNTHQMSGRT